MDMQLTTTEENYLKAIYKISEKSKKSARTSSIAKSLSTSSASVTDMLQKLAEKELINYEKYMGVTLKPSGISIATDLIRKHRLWEVFLVDKLRFSWDKVHDIAEHLEHIDNHELIARLDAYLDYPRFDPHGDPIPNAEGKITLRNQKILSDMHVGQKGVLIGVKEHSTEFLQYLNKMKMGIGSKIEILDFNIFDKSMSILLDQETELSISKEISTNLLIKP